MCWFWKRDWGKRFHPSRSCCLVKIAGEVFSMHLFGLLGCTLSLCSMAATWWWSRTVKVLSEYMREKGSTRSEFQGYVICFSAWFKPPLLKPPLPICCAYFMVGMVSTRLCWVEPEFGWLIHTVAFAAIKGQQSVKVYIHTCCQKHGCEWFAQGHDTIKFKSTSQLLCSSHKTLFRKDVWQVWASMETIGHVQQREQDTNNTT